jgi:endoglycosylceramidase
MNEPFIAARSTLHVPLAWLTRGRTDTYYLQPMYDRVEAAIRQHDDRSLIFWEPVCGSGGDLGAGFSKTPGDKPEKSVFSFHSYGPNAIDTLTMETAIQKGVQNAHRLGGAAMVSRMGCDGLLTSQMTEWDVEYVQGPRRLRKVLELADDVRLSWIGWQYKQFVRVAGSPPYGTLVDPRTGVYRPGMCKLFSRPYPSAVYGDLLGFNFNWTTSELTVRVAPPKDGEAEVVISVTEEDEWGWDGAWRLQHVAKADGERMGSVRVEKEKDLKKGGGGVRWWVEKAWVEGSKFVKIRLGEGWEGEATIVVGLEPSVELEKDQTVVIQEWNEKHAEWNATADDAWGLGM